MKDNLKSCVNFLSDCFIADRSRVGILNFFSKKVERRHVIKGEEKLLTGLLEEEILPPTYGTSLYNWASLYKREKELVYGAFFICGKIEGKTCRAPLLFYSASLRQQDEAVYVHVNLDSWRLNRGLIDLLDDSELLLDRLQQLFSSYRELTDGLVGELREVFDELKIAKTTALLNWPYLSPSGKLEKEAKETVVSIHPAGALGMVKRGIGARGVIDELSDLRNLKEADFSQGLKAFLAEQNEIGRADESVPMVPLRLSDPQEQVVKNSRSHSLSVCYGPPGTGKSLTIAAVAVDHANRGESVLIMSKMDHAVDVIEKKVDRLLDNVEMTVRSGRSNYLKELKSYLEMCLMRKVRGEDASEHLVKRNWTKLKKQINDSLGLEKQLSKEFQKSLARGKVRVDGTGLWSKLVDSYASWKVRKRALLVDMLDCIMELDDKVDELKRVAINQQHAFQLNQILTDGADRNNLVGFENALRKRRSADQRKLMNGLDFSVVLKALPVWLSKLDDLHRVLPMKKEMVDLLVIDEASQCDLASALPAMQRARRILIVGDPKQLKHVSFLSYKAVKSHASTAGISDQTMEYMHFRNVSLMDFALEKCKVSNSVTLLDEHFRSEPSIISFSNNQFYSGQLKLMRLPDKGGEEVLDFHHVEGVQSSEGVNEEELVFIAGELKKLLHRELTLPQTLKSSVGVISPFRKQVEAFEQVLSKECSSEEMADLIEQHELMVSTAHGFQGEERDVMYVSSAIGKDFSHSRLRFLQQEDVFNVLTTRSKNKQVMVYSFDPSSLPSNALLKSYFTHRPESSVMARDVRERDLFARELEEAFSEIGYSVTFSYKVAGVTVDLFLCNEEKSVALDLVGFPGEMENSLLLSELRTLRRAGLELMTIGYIEWQERREEVMERIQQYV